MRAHISSIHRLVAFFMLFVMIVAFCAVQSEAAEEQNPEKIYTVTPDPSNSVNNAKGNYDFSQTELTLDYEGEQIAATVSMPESDEKVPLIILCHGFTGSQNHFNSYAEVFATNGIASIRFDFPANGKSTGDSTKISLLTEKAVAEFVLEYCKKLEGINLNQIYLGGQSMGGLVATLCGAEHQDEIQGLILYYPGFPVPDFTRSGSVLGADFDLNNLPDSITVSGYTVGPPFFLDAVDLDVYGAILPSIEKDVLIFHGTKDDTIDLVYSKQALDVLPSAELVIVEGFGHGFPGFVLADIMPVAVNFIHSHSTN